MAENFRLTRTWTEDEAGILVPRVALVLDKFPELSDRQIVVGKRVNGKSLGTADRISGKNIRLIDSQVSYKTIGHELTHLLQPPSGMIPRGEIACDVWTITRDDLFLDRQPNYLVNEIRKELADNAKECFNRAFLSGGDLTRFPNESASNAAKAVAFYGFVGGYYTREVEQASYLIGRGLIRDWEEISEDIRDICTPYSKQRTFYAAARRALVGELADYAISRTVGRHAKLIDEKGAPRELFEIAKRTRERLNGPPPADLLLSGAFKDAASWNSIKIRN